VTRVIMKSGAKRWDLQLHQLSKISPLEVEAAMSSKAKPSKISIPHPPLAIEKE